MAEKVSFSPLAFYYSVKTFITQKSTMLLGQASLQGFYVFYYCFKVLCCLSLDSKNSFSFLKVGNHSYWKQKCWMCLIECVYLCNDYGSVLLFLQKVKKQTSWMLLKLWFTSDKLHKSQLQVALIKIWIFYAVIGKEYCKIWLIFLLMIY